MPAPPLAQVGANSIPTSLAAGRPHIATTTTYPAHHAAQSALRLASPAKPVTIVNSRTAVLQINASPACVRPAACHRQRQREKLCCRRPSQRRILRAAAEYVCGLVVLGRASEEGVSCIVAGFVVEWIGAGLVSLDFRMLRAVIVRWGASMSV